MNKSEYSDFDSETEPRKCNMYFSKSVTECFLGVSGNKWLRWLKPSWQNDAAMCTTTVRISTKCHGCGVQNNSVTPAFSHITTINANHWNVYVINVTYAKKYKKTWTDCQLFHYTFIRLILCCLTLNIRATVSLHLLWFDVNKLNLCNTTKQPEEGVIVLTGKNCTSSEYFITFPLINWVYLNSRKKNDKHSSVTT